MAPLCARKDSNLRPRAPEARALSPELRALESASVLTPAPDRSRAPVRPASRGDGPDLQACCGYNHEHGVRDRRPPQYRCQAFPASHAGLAAAERPRSSHARRRSRELSASGLTWVNVVGPDLETANMLSERFGWHPLDVEDIVSKRQRPEGRRLRGGRLPLHRPPLPRLRQGDPAAERGRARRVHRAGLPRHDPEPRAPPGHAAVRPLRERRGAARAALRQGHGPAALRGARRPLRLLLPDPRQDRAQARLDRGRHVRGLRRGRRPRHLERRSRRSSRTARS